MATVTVTLASPLVAIVRVFCPQRSLLNAFQLMGESKLSVYNVFEKEKPASLSALFEKVFDLGRVGYVAAEISGEVYMQAHPKLETTTTPESNFFEFRTLR